MFEKKTLRDLMLHIILPYHTSEELSQHLLSEEFRPLIYEFCKKQIEDRFSKRAHFFQDDIISNMDEAKTFVRDKINTKIRELETGTFPMVFQNYFGSFFFREQILHLVKNKIENTISYNKYEIFEAIWRDLNCKFFNKLIELEEKQKNMSEVLKLLNAGCPPQFYESLSLFSPHYRISNVFMSGFPSLSSVFFTLSEEKQFETLKHVQEWENRLQKTAKKSYLRKLLLGIPVFSMFTYLNNNTDVLNYLKYNSNLFVFLLMLVSMGTIYFCFSSGISFFSDNPKSLSTKDLVDQINEVAKKILPAPAMQTSCTSHSRFSADSLVVCRHTSLTH